MCGGGGGGGDSDAYCVQQFFFFLGGGGGEHQEAYLREMDSPRASSYIIELRTSRFE